MTSELIVGNDEKNDKLPQCNGFTASHTIRDATQIKNKAKYKKMGRKVTGGSLVKAYFIPVLVFTFYRSHDYSTGIRIEIVFVFFL